MSTPKRTGKVTLVTIIAAYEMQERIAKDLSAVGAKAYTLCRVEGHGVHGPRKVGLLDNANVRIDVLVTAERGAEILGRIGGGYAGEAVVAYAQEVEAVTPERFA